jgi:hypothetical protein
MDFGETIAATAIGATIPVLLAYWLSRRRERQQTKAWNRSGMGRYMDQALRDMDERMAKLADERESDSG